MHHVDAMRRCLSHALGWYDALGRYHASDGYVAIGMYHALLIGGYNAIGINDALVRYHVVGTHHALGRYHALGMHRASGIHHPTGRKYAYIGYWLIG